MTFAQHEPPARDPSTVAGTVYPPPWGYFATIAWALLIFGAASFAGITFYGWVVGFDQLMTLREKFIADPEAKYDGLLLSYVYVGSAAVQIGAFALLIRLKGWPIAEYLGSAIPSPRAIVACLALLAALVVLSDGAMALFGRNPVPEFQIVAYRTAREAGALPLLFGTIVLLAPITEEIMFRGFVFRGLVRRPSHAPYMILLISLAFAIIHQQYDLLGLGQVLAMALLLGWARYLSGSILLSIMMHVLANLIAMLETVVYLEWWPT
jgi:membrane protease YdiL (CAAX protease family)